MELTISNKKVLIDDNDFEIVNKYSWWASEDKKTKGLFYIKTVIGRSRKVKGSGKQLRLHRLIMNVTNPSQIVDHINGNTLDNRKCNLRITDSTGNARNTSIRKKKDKTIKYKGIYKRLNGKFQSIIRVNGKNITIGTFNTQKEAAEAYNNAALKYHKEFARLNELE